MGIHPLEKTSTGRCRRQGGEPALHRLAGKAGSLPFCPTHRHSGVNEYLRFVPLLQTKRAVLLSIYSVRKTSVLIGRKFEDKNKIRICLFHGVFAAGLCNKRTFSGVGISYPRPWTMSGNHSGRLNNRCLNSPLFGVRSGKSCHCSGAFRAKDKNGPRDVFFQTEPIHKVRF